MMAKIKKDNNSILIRALGYCCGRTGNDSWLSWLRENLLDTQYKEAKIGYFEGLAMIGSHEVIAKLETIDTDQDERDLLLSAALLVLSNNNINDAEELLYYWVSANPNRLWANNPAVLDVIEKLIQRSGPFLDKMINNKRFDTLCQGGVGRVAMQIAKVNPKLAGDWALRHDVVGERISAVNGVVLEQASRDSNDNLMITIDRFASTKKIPKGNMLREVLIHKIKNNIMEGESWINKIGETDSMFDQCCGIFVTKWSEANQMAASQWISELPEGHKRDISAFHLAASLKNAEEAMSWACSISNERLRKTLFNHIALNHDKDELESVINRSDDMVKLKPEEREIFFKLKNR
jgi:hypothetical protein